MSQVRTTKYGKKSFRFAAAVLWNSFPNIFRQVSRSIKALIKALISNLSGKAANVIYEGGSICNENAFITPSTNAVGVYAILEDFENASPYFCTFLANRICDCKVTRRF